MPKPRLNWVSTRLKCRREAEQWPNWLPSSLVNLGLDLRGGAHLLAEVKVEDVYESRMEAMWPEIRDALRGRTRHRGHHPQTAFGRRMRFACDQPARRHAPRA